MPLGLLGQRWGGMGAPQTPQCPLPWMNSRAKAGKPLSITAVGEFPGQRSEPDSLLWSHYKLYNKLVPSSLQKRTFSCAFALYKKDAAHIDTVLEPRMGFCAYRAVWHFETGNNSIVMQVAVHWTMAQIEEPAAESFHSTRRDRERHASSKRADSKWDA